MKPAWFASLSEELRDRIRAAWPGFVAAAILFAIMTLPVACVNTACASADMRERQKVYDGETLIAWNVGQGQWVTWVRAHECIHFDLGGERAPWAKVTAACAGKTNLALFSHWDWDHVGFAEAAARRLGHFCVAKLPLTAPDSVRKRELAAKLKLCPSAEPREISELTPRALGKTANASSRVFMLGHRALIPGDSTRSAEAKWSKRLGHAGATVPLLILGHHGSRTSTSEALLARLPGLKQALSSARHARFGHPHIAVVRALKAHHIALLRTEDWGHLIFELK